MPELSSFELAAPLQQDSCFVADWPLCQLRVINDQQYPWFLLIPRRAGVLELIDLTPEDYLQYQQESWQLACWLRQHFRPDKLNIAALGNVVSQLHIHHIARFKVDKAWPAPIWGVVKMQPYHQTELLERIRLWQQSLPEWPSLA
ncbi:HIT domain-containing protein [Alkalimonas sp.]|uniref:HIT domain-containing protein n=1 Tax=Alkalimonas sp. TaxID=1872453 RepID=UPI00263B7FB8|nr:HIT domain-containing protein [Alkalimonas sp.]MCC5826065.1 HIT domain-containing protein [Alkalimonas sp.]